MSIEKLKDHYSFTSQPSIYEEESMTALQLAGRLGAKLNEVIVRVNDIPDEVADAVDDVLRGGTFDKLIDEKMDNVNRRLDAISGTLTPGSTTFDAEIVDARVSKDGFTYPNLGEAIRSLEDQTTRQLGQFVSVNRLNPNTVVSGYLDPTYGAIMESGEYLTTDFIPIGKGETLALFHKDMTPLQLRFVATYDNNKRTIANPTGTKVMTYTQSGEVGYIRITYKPIAEASDLMVSDIETSSFAKYGEGKIVDSAIPEVMTNTSDKLIYTNRFSLTESESGYVNYLSGLVQENSSYLTSGFTKVKPGETLSLYNNRADVLTIRMVAFYDLKGQHIGGVSSDSTVIRIPAGVRFMRYSFKLEYGSDLMLTDSGAYKYLEPGEVAIRKSVTEIGTTKTNKALIHRESVLPANTTVELTDYPVFVQNGFTITVTGNVTSAGTISVGRKGGANKGTYGSVWFEINNGGIGRYEYYDAENSECIDSLGKGSSGVELINAFTITIKVGFNNHYKVTFATNTDAEIKKLEWEGVTSTNLYTGIPFLKSTTPINNLSFSISNEALHSDVWIFGDSFNGFGYGRVGSALRDKFGVTGFLSDMAPGSTSYDAYTDLIKALAFNKPKTLVWYVGLNDNYADFATYLEKVQNLCDANGITLILNLIPNTPNLDRSQHRVAVKASGYRYVDSYGAVGGVPGWLANMLDSMDETHPTECGAFALASRLIADVPELQELKGE